jgi:betaine-aldehyde dehydrogenase
MPDGQPLFIGGDWARPASGATIPVIDPATEEVLARVAAGEVADIDAAVQAARAAFDSGPWPRMPAGERAAVLRAIAAGLRGRLDTLAALEVRDNGKPLPEARWDIEDAIGCFDYYADLIEARAAAPAQDVALPDDRFTATVMQEPVGVAAAIIPWNYPLLMAAWKVAPALAAGCAMVLKPSELTPMTALVLAEVACEARLPAGVLNVVTGDGPGAGAPLASHPDVDKVAFTGSVPTGRRLMQAAAQDIKCLSLELGGKSPFLVFADSDIDAAVEWIMFGIFWNQGQVCSATSRVLVEAPLYLELLERLAAEAARIRIGNGMQHGVLMGPLISAGQRVKVAEAVAAGRAAGARLVCGGGVPAGFDRGYFWSPTILTDMDLAGPLWREEVFGPVLCVRPFATEAEGIALANDSRFGLAAAVMSADEARCARVAAALRAGIVWVNCSQPTFTQLPWGGYRQSGIGRELGHWGLENYLETKQITRFVSGRPWGWYLGAGSA